MSTTTPPARGDVIDQRALDLAAYERTEPLRMAVQTAPVPRITLEPIHAIARAMQISIRLLPLRNSIATQLPKFDLTHLDHLEDLARALRYAHTARQIRHEHDGVSESFVAARQQLGALLVRSHAQLRRAMDYLRFEEGDAAALVPSLYAPRSTRRKARANATEAGPSQAAEE